MISYIKGELVEVFEEGVVVESGGIGYEIKMPLSAISNLPRTKDDIKIYTYLYVREDAIGLFGFLTRDDLKTFKLLITVNGIGPKGALGILSSITSDNLRFAILSDDAKTIAKAPGIGSKTASKLILELKDKFKLEDVFEQSFINSNEVQSPGMSAGSLYDLKKEAIDALVVLGYSGTDAAKVISRVEIKEGMTSEQVLKLCLKNLV
ncbi:MAG: ruvA [Anaerocolumna sp.]|jgi:Holliday junction DNA helicase RuvA|nr:ruvA [Anaerocolumna sp.]